MNANDVYEYVEQRNLRDDNFKENISLLYKKNAKWILPFYDALSNIFFFWLRPKKNKKYLFLGNRFTHLIAELPKNEVCIIGGPRQLVYCLKNNLSYIPNGTFWKLLSLGFSLNIQKELCQISTTMSNVLAHTTEKTSQALLIVENDSLPLQRAFCHISTEIGIKTVCIQHGLFQSKTDARTIDGWKCDHFICYDDNQKSIISGLGIEEEKIIIGGFYQPIIKKSNQKKIGPVKVCFLGQPWFKYGNEYKNKYLNILNVLSMQLLRKDIEYSFKPHPWETDASYLKNMANIFNGNMNDALREHDVFLSFTSTALLEVTMAGKVAIQIYDTLFACDDFEKLGYAYSIQSEDIENALLKVINNPPFSLEMPDFNNLVHQIKKLAMVNM